MHALHAAEANNKHIHFTNHTGLFSCWLHSSRPIEAALSVPLQARALVGNFRRDMGMEVDTEVQRLTQTIGRLILPAMQRPISCQDLHVLRHAVPVRFLQHCIAQQYAI